MRKLKIGFSAGEVSGDFQASLLYHFIKEIAKLNNIEISGFGLGGNFLKNEGVEIFEDLTHRSSIGVFESIPYAFDRIKVGKKFLKVVQKEKPDIFIFVDNQGFNIPLSFNIKKIDFNIKTIYYFPPHISIWGKWNGKKLQKSINYFITPFYDDFLEYKKFNEKNVFFFGHPFFDENYLNLKFNENPQFIGKFFDFEKDEFIYIMPGSRDQEIKNLLPLFIEVADEIYKRYKIYSIIPVSNEKFVDKIKSIIKNRDYIFLLDKNYYKVFSKAKFTLMSSGTSTLEALLLNCPMLICYKISNITFFLGKFIVKTKWVGMSNIIAKKEIGKEFLQKDFNFENLFTFSQRLIEDKNFYENLKKEMQFVKENVNNIYKSNMLEQAAKFILNLN